jgi:hypothetical protein
MSVGSYLSADLSRVLEEFGFEEKHFEQDQSESDEQDEDYITVDQVFDGMTSQILLMGL